MICFSGKRIEPLRYISRLMITFFFVLKLDVLIAIFFGFFTIVFNINGIKQNKDDIGILWMERKIFTDDVQALKDYKSNYFFIKFPQWLRPLLVHNNLVWPVRMAEQTKFYKYVDEYKLFLDRISKIFFNIITMVEFITSVKIVVVLTANMDYYQDYPWINAIHKKKGKFIVLEKESIFFSGEDTTQNYLSDRYNKYGFKYEGDYVFFYNEMAERIYIDTGSIKQNQGFVTGCPRVDALTNIKKEPAKEKFILLSSFMNGYGAKKLWSDVINGIYDDEVLRRKTLVKCRTFDEANTLREKYPDIRTDSGPMQKYLLQKPMIVVGFGSTSLIDSLIVGIPILIPLWAEGLKCNNYLLGENTKKHHLIARDVRSLQEILRKVVGEELDIKYDLLDDCEFKEYLEKRYSPMDGKNTTRFFDRLDEMLNI